MNKIELQKIKEKALKNHIPIIMDDTLEYIYELYKDKSISSILLLVILLFALQTF